MLNKVLFYFQKINFLIGYLFKNEINEKKLYKKFITQEKLVVFDIGSNLGTYSIFISQLFTDKKLEIHSFEPINSLLDKQKIKYGKLFKNHGIISKDAGEIEFYERSITSQSSTKSESGTIGDKIISTYKVQSINLLDYILEKNIRKIDILKIDTEGSELDIMHSIKDKLVSLGIKVIKIETTYSSFDENKLQNVLEIFKILSENNYVYYGSNNTKYFNNKLLFSDSFFILDS
jgi:FkbM family methyltransferase